MRVRDSMMVIRFSFFSRIISLNTTLTENSILYTDGHADTRTDRQADSRIPAKTFALQGIKRLSQAIIKKEISRMTAFIKEIRNNTTA